jgi:hypothetical protein
MLFVIDSVPSFTIHFYQNSIANKWQSLVKESYVGDGQDIDHRRSFYHYRNKEDIQKDLIRAIKNINSFLKFNFIKIPNTIDWKDKNLYNDLHLYFEKLAGEFDNPTRLFKIAPSNIKESIRDLNYCVHNLEHDNIMKTNNDIKIQWTKGREQTKRIKLEKNEYKKVQFHKKKFEVYLDYNEVGKSFIDLWKDNLPKDYSNLKNNHYIGLDIFISLNDKKNIFDTEFVTWMQNNGTNPYNKELGIGLFPIGKCEIITIDHLTKDSKVNIII